MMLQRGSKHQEGSPSGSVGSTTEGSCGVSDDTCSGHEAVQLPTLKSHGEAKSLGSGGHPSQCTPCVFYCFKLKGCADGESCSYCHMSHLSRQRRRRDDWKRHQREQRKKCLQAPQSRDAVPVSKGISVAVPAVLDVEDFGPLRMCTLGHDATEPLQSPALLADQPCFISLIPGGVVYQIHG